MCEKETFGQDYDLYYSFEWTQVPVLQHTNHDNKRKDKELKYFIVI